MGELPTLVSDLAYILIVASAVTIVFKRLHQPLVLGYIVAGFLAGPHMPYTPSVSNLGSLEDWSQIGVIFMMFALGLEFSFKKIVKMGIKPIASALLVMACMISVGSAVGYSFGWGSMDRLFLGGMLAMSSTTIIYKAFGDLGLSNKKFASTVLSVLILEDILGILLMVILSTMAISHGVDGDQIMGSILKLGFFLILWFIVGVWLVPVILRRARKYINAETLVVVCVGLCFLMVVIAAGVGYSAAFGAFMMGSILSETIEAERIEHTISPLKDLFGAVFFVSVGMMVDPSVLIQYWWPILVISLAVTLGQMVFGSLSFLVTGNSLHNSIQSGFSLVQIGEFAFIIAALGQSLHVTSKFLYPVVVAVSILTTFLTPYIIRLADPAYRWVQKLLPQSMTERIHERQRSMRGAIPVLTGVGAAWKGYIRAVLLQTGAYLTLCVAFILFSFASLLPLARHLLTHWPGNIVCGLITLLLVAPCVRPIVMRRSHSAYAKEIHSAGKVHVFFFAIVALLRFSVGCSVIYYILNFLSPYWWVWHIAASAALMLLMLASRWVKWLSIKLERTFMQNLKSREIVSGADYSRRLYGTRSAHCAGGGAAQHALGWPNAGRTQPGKQRAHQHSGAHQRPFAHQHSQRCQLHLPRRHRGGGSRRRIDRPTAKPTAERSVCRRWYRHASQQALAPAPAAGCSQRAVWPDTGRNQLPHPIFMHGDRLGNGQWRTDHRGAAAHLRGWRHPVGGWRG